MHHGSYGNDDATIPPREEAIGWIALFSDTVGAILPYISQPAILEILDKIEEAALRPSPSSNRAAKALLSIVFAHALSTRDADASEHYYRQTLSLLDPRTLYAPSLELRTSCPCSFACALKLTPKY